MYIGPCLGAGSFCAVQHTAGAPDHAFYQFIQDLYQPLYLPRPIVGPDVVASPYPQTHDGSPR